MSTSAKELFETLCTDSRAYVHYTDAAGIDGMNDTGVIRTDGKGWVYFTREPFTQEQAHTNLFIGATTHAGRGSHVIVLSLDLGIPLESCSHYEERTQQSVRIDQHRLIYAGRNPWT